MKMKHLLTIIFFCLAISFANAQPCKSVKIGMTKAEVLKLAGSPTEIDTIFPEPSPGYSSEIIVVFQYGNVKVYGHQRVEFTGGKVSSDVIADGKKYDELLMACQHGDFPMEELFERIKKLNKEACK